jgi:acyl carrier protein
LLRWLASRNGGTLPGNLDSGGDAILIASGAEGWLDSFGVVELISAVESGMGIVFTELDFRDPRFGSLNGFVHLVSDKLAGTR